MKTETIEVKKEHAPVIKGILSMMYGKDYLADGKTIKSAFPVQERITSYIGACNDQDLTVLTVDHFRMITDVKEREAAFAHHQAATIIRSWNEGWVPDFSNYNERKYYIWGEYKKESGFAFSHTDYYDTYADTNVGSRLYFKNDVLAKAFITQFPELCKTLTNF